MNQSTLKAPAGYRPMEGKVSYAIGNDPSKHADNLNTYERVNLGDMYPGVNVQLRATGNNVEKIFTVAPKHDPKQIHIKLAGAEKLEIGKHGELIAHTGNGPVTFTAPIAFQENDKGERVSVDVAYALVSVGADLAALPGAQPSDAHSSPAAATTYSFTLGTYDRNQLLVIDPLLQSTYHGGTGDEYVAALAIHPVSGEVYIAGSITGTDLPSLTTGSGGVATGAQGTYGGGLRDAFVTRFNAALTARAQSTYLGGSGEDFATALAIHPATGDVYIAGTTRSPDLPSITTGLSGGVAVGAQFFKSLGTDAFVTRFNAALTARPQSTYLGGSGDDYAGALAIHPATGEVYIAGYTNSTDLPSVDPSLASGGATFGAQSSKSGNNDAFVTRFNAALTTRPQSTYLGGNGEDQAYALAIHPATGEVYIAGSTNSTNLPSVTPGVSGGTAYGAQDVYGGSDDAFVARFNAALTARPQSTYLGGTGTDGASAIAIHPATGDVYIAGKTTSADLPSVTPASGGVATSAQSAQAGTYDAFVTRFNAALTARSQSSYLGGSGYDVANALAIHPAAGEVYVAGQTSSANLPGVTTGSGGAAAGAQSAFAGNFDAFVSRFNAALTKRSQSTYLGGPGNDHAAALAIHPVTGEVYVAGRTDATNLPGVRVASGGLAEGAQNTKVSSDDAFVSRFSSDLAAGDFVPNPFAFAPKLNVPMSSLQTSAAAQVTGMLGTVPLFVTGGSMAEFCVSSSPGCVCDVVPFGNTNATMNNNQFVCVRQVAPAFTPGQTIATLVVGGGWADFIVSTGTQITNCNLDIDGSGGAPNAASDGLMLVRAMLGFTGTAVTTGAISGSPPRNTWPLIRQYLNDNCGTSFAP
jgi:hypothetical protein